MNQDQFMSLLRTGLKFAGAAIATYGSTQVQGLWTIISGALIAAAPIVWDIYVHSDEAKVAAVAAMPAVKGITVTDTDLASAAKGADPKLSVQLVPEKKA